MEGKYAVWLGRENVGQAIVQRRGLYYWFFCQCKLHSEVMCRVSVSCDEETHSLGILIPSGKDYTLTKKLPVKQFGFAVPKFTITPKVPQMEKLRIDIYPEEPFRYIAKLEKAYLDRRKGITQICIPNDHE